MKKVNRLMQYAFLGALFVAGESAMAISLDEYLTTAKNKNPLFQSYDLSVEAAKAKSDSSELELEPLFTAGYMRSADKSLPSMIAKERNVEQYNVGLAKKFWTGTAVKIEAIGRDFQNNGALVSGIDRYTTGELGVTVSQSLLKDFFGAGTRKKLERAQSEAKIGISVAELQRRGYLLQVESDFWDYILASEDVTLKKANLERAQRLEKWMSNRVGNGLGERADLYNIKALSTLRLVQYQMAQDELKNQEVKIRQNLSLEDSEAMPTLKGELTTARSYMQNLKNKKDIISLEAEVSRLEAETKMLASEEVADGLKPDLNLFGAYAHTSYDNDRSQAMKDIAKADYPKSTIGVNLSWPINTGAKNGLRDSVHKEALAAQIRAENKKRNAQSDWQNLQRKYEVAVQNVKTLEQVAQLQRERLKEEQNRFSKGRSITQSVVTAETDAAEAEISLLKARSGLRKLEASSLLYVSRSDVE